MELSDVLSRGFPLNSLQLQLFVETHHDLIPVCMLGAVSHRINHRPRKEYGTGKGGGEGNILRRTVEALKSRAKKQRQPFQHHCPFHQNSLNSATDTCTTSHKQSPLCLGKHTWPYTMSPTSGPLHSPVLTAGSDLSLYLYLHHYLQDPSSLGTRSLYFRVHL